MKQHRYEVRMEWTGNEGEGTKTYRGYRRDHSIEVNGKPKVLLSSDPAFRGDPARYNPEELLVASLSSCHMLWYLNLCSINKISVQTYADTATGVMEERPDGSGVFVSARLSPIVKISAGGDRAKALALHEDAHRMCFIANSVNFPVETAATIEEDVAVAP